MKKPEIKIDFKKLERQSQNTNWQKAVLGALVISLVIFLGALAYLFIRPLDSAIQASIDSEVESQQINFDFKTLEKLKSRQVPATTSPAPSGKNPFTPF